MPRRLSGEWKTTADAAAALACSTEHLLRQVRNQRLKPRRHWRNLNPDAARPTYRWHVRNIQADGLM